MKEAPETGSKTFPVNILGGGFLQKEACVGFDPAVRGLTIAGGCKRGRNRVDKSIADPEEGCCDFKNCPLCGRAREITPSFTACSVKVPSSLAMLPPPPPWKRWMDEEKSFRECQLSFPCFTLLYIISG